MGSVNTDDINVLPKAAKNVQEKVNGFYDTFFENIYSVSGDKNDQRCRWTRDWLCQYQNQRDLILRDNHF